MKTSLIVSIAAIACASAAAPTLTKVLQSSASGPDASIAASPAGALSVAQAPAIHETNPNGNAAPSAPSPAIADRETTSEKVENRLARSEDGRESLDPKDSKDLAGIGFGPQPLGAPYIPGALGFPPTFGTSFRSVPRSN